MEARKRQNQYLFLGTVVARLYMFLHPSKMAS